MLTFMQALPDALQTNKVKVLTLVRNFDGWFLEFELIDEEGVVHIGARLMSSKAMFTGTNDLIDELWWTPGLVTKYSI